MLFRSVDIMKYRKGDYEESHFMTRLASKMIKPSNKDREANIAIVRSPYHSTFNYLWQILLPNLVESVGVSQKEQEEALHAVGFFMKVKNFFTPKKKRKKLIIKYPEMVQPIKRGK